MDILSLHEFINESLLTESKESTTVTTLLFNLTKAGIELPEEYDDAVKNWSPKDEDKLNDISGDLTVSKTDGDDLTFNIEKGVVYYQGDSERSFLGNINDSEDLIKNIQDVFEIKPEEEESEDDSGDKKDDSGDDGLEL